MNEREFRSRRAGARARKVLRIILRILIILSATTSYFARVACSYRSHALLAKSKAGIETPSLDDFPAQLLKTLIGAAMLKLGAAMLKVTNALTYLTNRHSNYWVRHKGNLPIGTDLRIDIMRLEGVDVRRIFDVGANRGQTYRRFRSDFPKAAIHCFEPIAAPFAELVAAAMGDQNVQCEMLALGSAPGTAAVRLYEDADYLNSLRSDVMNQSPLAKIQSVAIDTVDRYVATRGISHVDLLKIDTEGFELPVLEGARDSLAGGKVSLVLGEVGFSRDDVRHTNFFDLTDAMYRYNFHLFGVYDLYHLRGDTASGNRWVGYANALYVAQRHVSMYSY